MENKNENTPMEQETPAQTGEVAETPRGFSNKRNFLIIVIALVVLLIGGAVTAVAVTAVAVTRGGTQTAESIMTLAERYLKEEKYEQAVIEFQRVIELDPMNVDAYLNLAEAYTGLGSNEKALEVLRQGLEATGDSRLQAKIDELSKPAESSGTVQTGSSTPQGTTSTPAEHPDDEPRATREYDEQNRLVFETVTTPDGIMTETHYGEYSDNEGNVTGWGIIDKYVYRIDENGDSIPSSEYYYSSDDILDWEIQYNDRGDIIKGRFFDDNETETTTHTYTYEYGPFGPVKSVRTDVDTNNGETHTSVFTINYTYNADGKLISETETSADGDRSRYVEYKYDADGRRLEHHKQNYGRNGSLIVHEFTATWKYNDDGKCIELYQSNLHHGYNENHWDNEHIRIDKWNDAHQKIEHTVTDKHTDQTEVRTTTYTYNENGRVDHTTESTTYTDGRAPKTSESVTTWVYEYDELGRVILETGYDESGNFAGKKEYEY